MANWVVHSETTQFAMDVSNHNTLGSDEMKSDELSIWSRLPAVCERRVSSSTDGQKFDPESLYEPI